ncbi:hypothetical protein CSB45_03860 [candidate division KSB3 bacterium]|uniref:VanZ-like domain-containing protein n=1 Tax=candidate division KSB3 bacterium TaxID=2044937 RepID=A0A2G6E9C7_9BACT|nr:MAG: hypothetical protein CSB45_03860 [candidate division KSB3 bacterium]PIE30671.1 MAG: hypothetical protein CSA57_02445 [candidate division KSB3 bacterium]
MLAVFVVSAQSNPRIGGHTPDYVLHALEYVLLALLLIRLLLSRHNGNNDFARWQYCCLMGMLLAVAYGISDEVHQYFIPGRHCSLHDVLADAFGASVAYAAGCLDYLIVGKRHAWSKQLMRLGSLASISYAVARLKCSNRIP